MKGPARQYKRDLVLILIRDRRPNVEKMGNPFAIWRIVPDLPKLDLRTARAPLRTHGPKKEIPMKHIALILAAVAFSGAASAQTLPDVPDTDGNGTWSLTELQAVWTGLTEEAFAAIDVNSDGGVDPVELQAALDSGVITAP